MCLDRDDTTLYLVGGFNTGSVSIDLLKFDIQNQKWSRPLVGGPVPPERYCHSVVNIDSNLIVFGGFSVEGKWLNDLHALDTEYAMNSEFQAFVPRLSAYGQCKASTNNSQMLLWYGDPTMSTLFDCFVLVAICNFAAILLLRFPTLNSVHFLLWISTLTVLLKMCVCFKWSVGARCLQWVLLNISNLKTYSFRASSRSKHTVSPSLWPPDSDRMR